VPSGQGWSRCCCRGWIGDLEVAVMLTIRYLKICFDDAFAEDGHSCFGLCKGSCPPGQLIAIPPLLLQACASFPCRTVIPDHSDSHPARSRLDMLDCSILQSHTLCHLPAGKKASSCLHLDIVARPTHPTYCHDQCLLVLTNVPIQARIHAHQSQPDQASHSSLLCIHAKRRTSSPKSCE